MTILELLPIYGLSGTGIIIGLLSFFFMMRAFSKTQTEFAKSQVLTADSNNKVVALATSQQNENERLGEDIRALTKDLYIEQGKRVEMETNHAEERKKWKEERQGLQQRIQELQRDVDALKKQKTHQDKHIAEQVETITSLETENKRLNKLLAEEQKNSGEHFQQLQLKLVELRAEQEKRKECEEQAEDAPDETLAIVDKPPQDLADAG